MSRIKRQLETAQSVWNKAGDAQKEWNSLLSTFREKGITNAECVREEDAKNATEAILAFMRVVTETAQNLSRKAEERRRKFENTPVLQAVIAYDGKTRTIPVSVPNGRIDDPFITERFYRAIRENWKMPDEAKIVSCEDFDIVVIDQSRRIKTTIFTK